jgi:hypothetical protein
MCLGVHPAGCPDHLRPLRGVKSWWVLLMRHRCQRFFSLERGEGGDPATGPRVAQECQQLDGTSLVLIAGRHALTCT